MEHSFDEIFHVEAQLQQAFLKNDIQAFDQLLHDDLVFTNQAGIVLKKQEDLDAHASGMLQVIEYELLDPLVRLYGETAIVVVKVRLGGTYQETAFSGEFRYTRIWLFQKDRWQMIAGHCSEIVESNSSI